jgi:hypothetical protein
MKQLIVYGYFVGTEAYNVAFKPPPEGWWILWPPKTDDLAVKSEVDKHCQKPENRDTALRDVLYVTTLEMSLQLQSKTKP